MSKLTILRGLSGSGKSTWARAHFGSVVVSRDDLRVAIFGGDGPEYYKRNDLRACEDIITKVEYSAILEALSAGKNVIADNTHIEWKYVRAIAEKAMATGAEIEIKVFDVPLKTAQERNALRAKMGGRNVPGEAIAKQHKRFQGTKSKTVADLPTEFIPEPYSGTPGKPKAVLVDIDGTLAIMGDRSPYDWKRVGVDSVNHAVQGCVESLHAAGYKIIVVSGRDSACRGETERWLDSVIEYDALFMRPEKDVRKDNIVKHEIFNENIRHNYDVKFCLDDRDQVVKTYRDMGLSVFQVNYGDF